MLIGSGVRSFSNQELRRCLRMSRQSNGLRGVLTSTWFWWPQLIADCAAWAVFLLSSVKKLLNNQTCCPFTGTYPSSITEQMRLIVSWWCGGIHESCISTIGSGRLWADCACEARMWNSEGVGTSTWCSSNWTTNFWYLPIYGKRVGRPWVVMCTSCPLPRAVVMPCRNMSCSCCRASRITKSRSETTLMEFWMILLHDPWYQRQHALIPRI